MLVDLLLCLVHRGKPSPFGVSFNVVLLFLLVPNDVQATIFLHLFRRSKIIAERESPTPFEAGLSVERVDGVR